MRIYLKVKPSQRFSSIERKEEEWIVRLAAPAIDGQANSELVRFIAQSLNIPKSSVQLVKGQTSRLKCLEIQLSEEEVMQRLMAGMKQD